MSKKKKYTIRSSKFKKLYKKYLIYSGVIGAVWMGLFFISPFLNQPNPSSSNPSIEQNEKELNRMKATHLLKSKIKQDEVRRMFDNLQQVDVQLDHEILEPHFESKDEVSLAQEELFKDFIEEMDQIDSYTSIEDQVASYSLYKPIDEKITAYQQRKPQNSKNPITDKEFIQQFIENARQKGYEIQVNDQMKVTSIRKIK